MTNPGIPTRPSSPANRRSQPRMKSLDFRHQRERSWRRLDALLTRVEKRGVRSLTSEQIEELPMLHRATLSSLSVARSISLDRNIVEYLDHLALRSHNVVYGVKQRPIEWIVDFFARRWPQAVRRLSGLLLLVTALFGCGVATGYALVARDSDQYYAFVNHELAAGRDPAASTEFLRKSLYDSEVGNDGELVAFSGMLFAHNARIGILCFALGIATGIPTALLVFLNGAMMGAFLALFASRSLFMELAGWLGVHGVTEILAILLCGAAGLHLAQAWIFPGARSRREQLARNGRRAATVVLGGVVMFAIAGLIEGIIRQTVTNDTYRYAFATATAVFWLAYFGFAGRDATPAEGAR